LSPHSIFYLLSSLHSLCTLYYTPLPFVYFFFSILSHVHFVLHIFPTLTTLYTLIPVTTFFHFTWSVHFTSSDTLPFATLLLTLYLHTSLHCPPQLHFTFNYTPYSTFSSFFLHSHFIPTIFFVSFVDKLTLLDVYQPCYISIIFLLDYSSHFTTSKTPLQTTTLALLLISCHVHYFLFTIHNTRHYLLPLFLTLFFP
jgi:hypothetical protein